MGAPQNLAIFALNEYVMPPVNATEKFPPRGGTVVVGNCQLRPNPVYFRCARADSVRPMLPIAPICLQPAPGLQPIPSNTFPTPSVLLGPTIALHLSTAPLPARTTGPSLPLCRRRDNHLPVGAKHRPIAQHLPKQLPPPSLRHAARWRPLRPQRLQHRFPVAAIHSRLDPPIRLSIRIHPLPHPSRHLTAILPPPCLPHLRQTFVHHR